MHHMRRFVGLAAGILVAAAFGQFPEYAQQYTQRLGGAVDELRVIVANFDAQATQNGFDRAEALRRYEIAGDTFLVAQGTDMARTISRYDDLSAALVELENATPFERLQNLPLYLDTDIGARTLEAYRPAVPVTVEGFAYAAAGLALGYLLASAVFRLFALLFRPRRYKYPTAQ
jgi:hypothetical protein